MIVAEGLTSRPDSRMAMLVLRRKAARTRYLAVLEPVDPANPVRSVTATSAQAVIDFASGTRRAALD